MLNPRDIKTGIAGCGCGVRKFKGNGMGKLGRIGQTCSPTYSPGNCANAGGTYDDDNEVCNCPGSAPIGAGPSPNITVSQSQTNCVAGGGTYNVGTGVCSAPPGGSLYTSQLAAMAAAECPWYCLPFISYNSTSPCFNCQTPPAAFGGLPFWAWIGIGIGAVLYIAPKIK